MKTNATQRWFFPTVLILAVFGLFGIVILISPCLSHHHPSDRTLMRTFQEHRQDFEKLVTMANEDSNVEWLFNDFVMFNDYTFWPKDGGQVFSWQRWNEYDAVFKKLGKAAKHQFEKESALVLIPASVNTTDPDVDYQYRVSVKGYAYSRAPISTIDSLDGLGVENLGRAYRRIDQHWYLYHDCGIGKPE